MESEPQKPRPSGSGRGGYREGAGRKPDSHNRFSKEAREAAQATGRLPHEILLDIARGEPQEVTIVDAEGKRSKKFLAVNSLDDVRAAAQAAAPYFAPKISTVEFTTGVSDDDLLEFVKRAAEEAGFSLSTGGAREARGREEADGEEESRPASGARIRLVE